MKKELILLNELSSLFTEGREYKIEFRIYPKSGHKGFLDVEIDFTENELSFVKSIIRDRIIDGCGMVIDLPKMDMDFKPIPKCFTVLFVPENQMKDMDLTLNY